MLRLQEVCTSATENAASASGATSPAASGTVQAPGAPAPSGSLAARLNAVETGEADKTRLVLPNWQRFPAGATPVQVALRAGLGLTGVNPSQAKNNPGDVPIAAFVEDISATQVHIRHHNSVIEDKQRSMSQYSRDDGAVKQDQAEVDHRGDRLRCHGGSRGSGYLAQLA